jgi:hypothetical protein
VIQGEVGREVEYVEVVIFNENSNNSLYSFSWNRSNNNLTETFNIVIPGTLKSDSKYDFKIITYKQMSAEQKKSLTDNLAKRVSFFLQSNIQFDGKNVIIKNPGTVHRQLKEIIDEALGFQVSKNSIPKNAPSSLVLEELKSQGSFRFDRFLRKTDNFERDSIANLLILRKVDHLTSLIISELAPFINSDLVQHHRAVVIQSVITDKEPFTLPVNIGMYAWDKSLNLSSTSVHNINFTPGAGITIPFSNKSRLAARSKLFDSFGYSAGVLFKPVKDANGTEFVTPGINLPVYTGLGFRLFKVIRFNAGVLILGEKGLHDFSDLSLLPTAGLSLELNIWMGLKK